MRIKSITALMLCTVLASCVAPNGGLDSGPGSLLSQGSLLGDLGNDLDPASRRIAVKAELEALSKGVAGVAVDWVGKKETSGSVVPGQRFEVAGRICRQYSHTIKMGAVIKAAKATACENESGLWEPLQ